MKKIFISQPMRGLSEKEIIENRRKIISEIEEKIGPFEAIGYVNKDEIDKVKEVPVWCLGKSIMKLGEADAVYFADGWENARACKIEHEIAVKYGIKIIEL